MTQHRVQLCLASLSLAIFTVPAFAQIAPDAGQLLQQEREAPSLPKASPSIQIAPALSAAALPGGATVSIKAVRFVGNSTFTAERLSSVLGDVSAKPYDLAGLQALAQTISEYYRTAGYPFARAFIPEQRFADGILQIALIEGRYGNISTTGNSKLAPAAQRFLADLVPGTVIETAALERTTLILSDQPGIQIAPLIRPGQEVGTGDLVVNVSSGPAFSGQLRADNHGNRYTGEYRAVADLQWDSPFTLGDQVYLSSNVSDEGQWMGNLSYSLPLNSSGLRGSVGYARIRYELAKEFANLDATGTAGITSTGLSYPLVRSHQANLTLAGAYQHKKLVDKQGATDTRNDKTSHVGSLTFIFDYRDGLGGGGINFGNFSYSHGTLNLDTAAKAADAITAQSQGSFDKLNLDVARLQATPVNNLTLYGRLSTQWAGKNLDSSEDFGLGGANGVRAYPSGEGYGDEGWLAQIEARYQLDSITPFIFYDAGHVKINESSWATGDNERDLSGYGLGLRYSQKSWSIDASLAWRAGGGEPLSDTKDRNPHAWINAIVRF